MIRKISKTFNVLERIFHLLVPLAHNPHYQIHRNYPGSYIRNNNTKAATKFFKITKREFCTFPNSNTACPQTLLPKRAPSLTPGTRAAPRHPHTPSGTLARAKGLLKPRKNSLSGQLQGRRPLPLEHPVHEHAVLAVADHVEVGRLEVYLDVASRNKAIVAHVDVHVALAGVAPDDHPTLAHHVFEFLAFQSGNGRSLPVGGPRHAVRRGWRGLLKG